MNLKYLVLTVLFYGLIVGCDNNNWSASPDDVENNDRLIRSSSKMGSDSRNIVFSGKEDEQEKIRENLKVIQSQITRLDKNLEDSAEDLSESAKSSSKQLRNDLVRIQRDLERKFDDLNNSLWDKINGSDDDVEQDIEHVEDELNQIDEQIDEWYEDNIK